MTAYGENLTYKQLRTLALLSNGLSHKEIAQEMNISIPTVDMHVRGLKQKLNAKTNAHAVAIAFRKDILF